MDPDFWLERWQRGETGWHRDEINRHLREFWPQVGVPTGTRVLVPLCGKTIDLLWLASRGYRVLGVELSQLAVEGFFADQGLKPIVTEVSGLRRYRVDEIELWCGNFFDLTPALLGDIGAVYDRAALIALPPALRARYAAHLDTLLSARVPRLLITLEYDQGRRPGPPFCVLPTEVEHLFGRQHLVSELARFDVLGESPGFQQCGLTELVERVYRLDVR
ncbi:MAG TPA: thiopurine S-methyltransferase [Lamprocystis sp. (in: g-proteobacteria)]|nr:thiopurine S-methyltransferase [Lamprocystis sp. (in: g-proteobacteria)]